MVPMRSLGAAGLLVLAVVAGCASPPAAESSSAPPEPTSPTTTQTPITTETPTAEPTLAPTPTGPPTYSQVVATYPSGTDTCDTVADLVAGGYNVTGGSISMKDGEFVMPCYGAKITVTETSSVDGVTYEPGTTLTVDAQMNLVPVSSWE